MAQKKYKEFLNVAKHYTFLEKSGISYTMTKYYMGLIQLYGFQDIKSCIENAVTCIITNPLMAEFWCLLGDAYYVGKDYKKAQYFYENAIFLGTRRETNDIWPLEISKYKEHPNKMIKSCKELTNH